MKKMPAHDSAVGERRRQRDRVLAVLRNSEEVGAIDLARISLQYGRAIHELRKLGYEINNRVVTVNGQRRGYFKLIERATQPHSPQPTHDFGSLFGIPEVGRHRDDG